MKKTKKLDTTITDLFNGLTEYKDKNLVKREDKPNEFRVSSLPYCSILDLKSRLELGKSEFIEIETDFSMEFYTQVGTIIHSVLQDFLPKISKNYKIKIFGSWKHKKTGKIRYKMSFLPYSKVKKYEYAEIDFNYNELTGHLDLLLQDKNGKWHALEFKSTSSFLINDPRKAIRLGYFPQKKHLRQIRSYCVLLYKCHKIRVHKYHIIYINRDKIQQTNQAFRQHGWGYHCFSYLFTKKIYKEALNHIENSSLGKKSVDLLMKKVKSSKRLQKVIDLKPCKVKQDYLDVMRPAFFGDENCEFFRNGSCFREGDMNKILRKHIKEYEGK